MARVSRHAWGPRKEPILDHYVQASIDGGMDNEGHYSELVYAGVEDQEWAKEIRRALFRSSRYLKVALKADLEQAADGTHQIRFHAIDKARARAYIVAQAQGDPSRLAYNPYRKRSQ
jgi:hypothetical protein